MKEIQLYDIITLDHNEEYAVLNKQVQEGQTYYVLAPVDVTDEPDLENIKIVEQFFKEDKITLKDLEDENKIAEIAKKFLSELTEDFD